MGAWARAVVMMARVKKTTGGKLWHKLWGIPKVTPTQKVNYKKRNRRLRSNLDVLRVAHAAEEAAKGGNEKIVIPSFEKSAINFTFTDLLADFIRFLNNPDDLVMKEKRS